MIGTSIITVLLLVVVGYIGAFLLWVSCFVALAMNVIDLRVQNNLELFLVDFTVVFGRIGSILFFPFLRR